MVELEIKKMKLGSKFCGLKIVHVSDLHISKLNIELLDEVLEKINSLKADIVVITGDFICNGGSCMVELKHFLKQLDAKIAKYACMGNHDYSDDDCGLRVEKVLKDCDFRLLRNCRDEVFFNYSPIGFAGLDDVQLGTVDFEKTSIEREDIVLSHNPIAFAAAARYSPLMMLAGHTHGGHIKCDFLRFICNNLLKLDYLEGFYRKDESLLYVNRGIGDVVFKPKIFNRELTIPVPRFNSSSEITVFEFV